jgi:NodT family efflux transporter outer membrane factor (OMF) lipoprotein
MRMRTVAAMRALFIAAVAAIGGCTVGPDYVRPPVAAPDVYKEAKDWKPGEPRSELPRGRWWELFGDARLDALIAEVDVDNQTLRAAEARVRQAEALTEAARSRYYPTLGAGGTNLNVVLVTWELDLWGRIRRTVEGSNASAEAAADELAAARLSLQAQVAQNYLLLRVQDAEIRLLQDSVARYERSLQLTRNQYAVGVASRGDVAQAETQLMSTRAQALEAAVTRAQLEHAIAVLIGKAPAELTIAAAEMEAKLPAVPPALPSELLERRPDIAAAERRMAAANAQIGVAEAAYYPSVSLSAGAEFGKGEFKAGATYGWAFFDGGLRQAQSAQASAAYDETFANYRQTILTAFREVEDNLVALSFMTDEAEAQGAAVRAARESVRIANNQYRAGLVNYLAVVVVQASALINERAQLAIDGRRLVASVNLIKALGGGWQAPVPQAATKQDPAPSASRP